MHSSNPGPSFDYWMRCDVCGFDYRRSQMRQRWDGLWTCHKDWEPRHPQDFVKGRPDRQSVPVARPDNVNFTNTTTLNGAVAKGASSIVITSATDIADNDSIGITLDDGSIQWTVVYGWTSGTTIPLMEPLSGAAASGNTVYTAGDSFLNADISASDL